MLNIRNISHVMSKNSSFLKTYPKNKKQRYSESLDQDQSNAIYAIQLERIFQKFRFFENKKLVSGPRFLVFRVGVGSLKVLSEKFGAIKL